MIRKVAPFLTCLLFLFACKKETNEPLTADRPSAVRAGTSLVQTCNSCKTQYIQFRGIRPDDSSGREALPNPERGLRLEYIIKTNNLLNPYYGTNYSNNMSNEILKDERHYNEKTRVTQLYFYLTDYMKTKIPDHAFQNMQAVLDEVKQSGYKVVLLFAYRYDDNCDYETYDAIKRHLAQLKPFLQKNEPVIFAFQAGFLGLWGEWHHSGLDNSPYQRKVVIRDILKTIPASRKMQVRETKYKTETAGYIRKSPNDPIQYYPLNEEEYNRIGFQSAYFVLDQGPYAHWDYRWPDDDYYMVEKEALSTIVDGEMPYDGSGWDTFNIIAHGNQGGWEAIKRMRAHAFSTFSIVHNFGTNIVNWQKQPVSASDLLDQKMTVTDDYFLDQTSRQVPRTAYEYIRDHLGYRYQLQDATFPSSIHRGDSAKFSIRLKNFGFAPLINKRPVYLVLIDEQNKPIELLTNNDPRSWLPASAGNNSPYILDHSFLVDNTFAPGQYKVGLWLPDDAAELKYNSDYAIRFANGNMEWWTGSGNNYLVNIIGSLEIN